MTRRHDSAARRTTRTRSRGSGVGATVAGLVLLACTTAAAPASAQWSAAATVAETAGIRRTAFPASALLEVPQGRLEYVSQVRLVDGGDDVPYQGTAWSRWPDGSIRELEVDFNLSIGPFEERSLELHYGSDVTGGMPAGRGLSAMEDERTIEAGAITLNKGGSTLVASVAYRDQVIGTGRNGLTVVERSGIRRDPREIRWEAVELVKAGPLRVLARYRGSLALSGGSVAEITLDAEIPNSKSWLKLAVSVADPDGKIGDLGFETPLRLGPYPWTWDFGTPNGTYGAFRDPTGSTILARTVDEAGVVGWQVRAGAAGSEEAYEVGEPGDVTGSATWAHMVGGDEAVAFAVEEGTGQAGTLTGWLTGTGQTTFTFESAEPATEHELTLWQHYVSTPVPIGAATSPASMLSPLRVTVE